MKQAQIPQANRSARAIPAEGLLQLQHQGVLRQLKASDCPFTLGRAPGNALQLVSDAASRMHGRIEWQNGHFCYRDCSRNGTYVLNGHGEEKFVHQQSITLPRKGVLSPARNVLEQAVEVVRFVAPRGNMYGSLQATTKNYS